MRKATRWQDRVTRQADTGCWTWQGRRDSRGHGKFNMNGKTVSAHRVAWAETNGPIPDGVIVGQTCGDALCCNPAHLFLLTVEDLGRARATEWRDRLTMAPDGCWLWQGSVNNDGYGQIRRDGRTVRLHRLAWEEANGPIPAGMRVCHTCDVPACCNPAHLFLGTQQDNVTDMIRKGRFKGRAFLNAQKTHCPQGHEYTPENTMTFNGMRSCRQCMNDRAARYSRTRRRK